MSSAGADLSDLRRLAENDQRTAYMQVAVTLGLSEDIAERLWNNPGEIDTYEPSYTHAIAHENGDLELVDTRSSEAWIATNTPVEVRQ